MSGLGEAVEQPDNVRSVAELLNAAIEPMGMPARGRGYLTRDGNNWIVRLEGDISNGLNNDQEFIVAHELAHLLLIEAGAGFVCSDAEYWALEEVCDRVAHKLLLR